MPQLDLRAKLIARIGLPASTIAVTALAMKFAPDRGIVIILLYLVLTVQVTYTAWRQRIIVRENTLFVHDGMWREPVLLDHLTEARFLWRTPFRSLTRTVLRLTDSGGATVDISLRRWRGWRDLVAVVIDVSGIVPEGPTLFPVASRPWSSHA
jgi:hypothetical protein